MSASQRHVRDGIEPADLEALADLVASLSARLHRIHEDLFVAVGEIEGLRRLISESGEDSA